MKTHKETYPEQYAHPLVGKLVEFNGRDQFIVARVVNTRFGLLAIGESDPTGYPIGKLQVIEGNDKS